MAYEKGMESSILASEVVVPIEVMEFLAPVSALLMQELWATRKSWSLQLNLRFQFQKGVGPIVEDPLPGKNVTPKVEENVPYASSEMATPIL